MYCNKCGELINKQQKFCQKCGSSVMKTPQSTSKPGAVQNEVHESKNMVFIKDVIRCEDCGYEGIAESGRTRLGQLLAWLSIFISWLITIIYYGVTSKYVCPKCKSKKVFIRDEAGLFIKKQAVSELTTRVVYIFFGTILAGSIVALILVL